MVEEPSSELPEALVESVLDRLAMARAPSPDLPGLALVYDAWCRRVPFDNVQKRIHIDSGSAERLPGDSPTVFFDDWLRHGTGGTCWAGNGALAALLGSIGFAAQRGIGTMMAGPDPTPNHGTVVVSFDDERYLVDASMLHGEPLLLSTTPTTIEHPSWGVSTLVDEGVCTVRWTPFHAASRAGMSCRIDAVQASADEFRRRHENTRSWSPFNFGLSARLNRSDEVIGAAFGQQGHIAANGSCSLRPFSDDERTHLLVDEIGMSEEIVAALPDDQPMPPPTAPGD